MSERVSTNPVQNEFLQSLRPPEEPEPPEAEAPKEGEPPEEPAEESEPEEEPVPAPAEEDTEPERKEESELDQERRRAEGLLSDLREERRKRREESRRLEELEAQVAELRKPTEPEKPAEDELIEAEIDWDTGKAKIPRSVLQAEARRIAEEHTRPDPAQEEHQRLLARTRDFARDYAGADQGRAELLQRYQQADNALWATLTRANGGRPVESLEQARDLIEETGLVAEWDKHFGEFDVIDVAEATWDFAKLGSPNLLRRVLDRAASPQATPQAKKSSPRGNGRDWTRAERPRSMSSRKGVAGSEASEKRRYEELAQRMASHPVGPGRLSNEERDEYWRLHAKFAS